MVILAIVVIGGALLMGMYEAKKFCKENNLNFKRYFFDKIRGKVRTDDPYWMIRYLNE